MQDRLRSLWAKQRWLVSPRYDLFFFIGSCVITWIFLGLYHLIEHLGVSIGPSRILITYFIYTALFDQPHIFQTFARTHADTTEYKRRKPLHTWGLLAFVIAGVVLSIANLERELIIFAAIYGSWHIIRQHWGFLRIYKALNRDMQYIDNVVDGLMFYTGMAAFILYDYVENPPQTVIYGDLWAPFPSAPEWLGQLAWYAFMIALALFVIRQLTRLSRGESLNLPKLIFLTAAMGTHGLVFFFTATPFLVAEALETSYHNVQYQGFMMHFQRKRLGAHLVKRWLLAALSYGLIIGALEVLALYQRSLAWLFAPFSMVVIYHYYVDGKIWKMRESPELREALLAQPQGARYSPHAHG